MALFERVTTETPKIILANVLEILAEMVQAHL